jgi:hypothetical protein
MEWNEKTDFNLQIGEELRIGKWLLKVRF